MKGLFTPQIDLSSRVLDIRLERQNLVMANLSNINTPGYKARRLEFEDELQEALNLGLSGKMTRTNEKHIPGDFNANGFDSEHYAEFEPRQVFGEDKVDLDKEMAVMAKNSLMYDALAQVIKKNFEGIQRVIQEGAK